MMFRAGLFALLLSTSAALAQQMVPARNGSCPSGSSHAGAGYCRTDGRTEYVPSRGGSCPSGTSHVGAGYCKAR